MPDLELVLGAIQDTADDLGLNGDDLSEKLVRTLEALRGNLERRMSEAHADLIGEQHAAADQERPY